jgi:NTE family protein
MSMDAKAPNSSVNRPTLHSDHTPPAIEADRGRPIEVMLALQGGGSHSAFTWGVLDYLLDRQKEGEIEITAVSGTSGGAVNAVLVGHGLQVDPARAQKLLRDFWFRNSIAAAWSLSPFSLPFPLFQSWNIDHYPWVIWLSSLGLAMSPYQKAPGENLLAQAILSCIDFSKLNQPPGPNVYVLSTNARTGRSKTFRKTFDEGTMSVDAVLASACIPTVFPAVVIDGDPHWDGGYLKDPGLFPLVNRKENRGTDILIIGVNELSRPAPFFPVMAWEIADRLNELSFNSSLMAEVEKICLVNEGLSQGVQISAQSTRASEDRATPQDEKKRFYMHYLEPAPEMNGLGMFSKYNASYPFALYLYELGKQEAARWWPGCYNNLGRNDTDLQKITDYEHVKQAPGSAPSVYQAAQHFIDGLVEPLRRNWSLFPAAQDMR